MQIKHSSIAVAVLFQRDIEVEVEDVFRHLEHRGLVVNFSFHRTPVRAVIAYLPASGRILEYRHALEWFRSFLLVDNRILLMSGDFQCNTGWTPAVPSSDPERVQVLLDLCCALRLVPIPASCLGPTWVNHQGHVGANDHFITHAS